MGATDRFDSSDLLADGTPGDLADLAEIERYADTVAAFAEGTIPEDRFTTARLQQGCYGQRQPGVNMLRIKAPGGKLAAAQLDALADVVATFSVAEDAHAHVTTRESIQIHSIPLARTPDAMRRLAQAGLTTREACGHTVRNMTACSMAGACPKEHTDVNGHLMHAARYFLRNPLNQQMPRKFKISFSACESDCAQGLLHDLAVVATRRDGRARLQAARRRRAGPQAARGDRRHAFRPRGRADPRDGSGDRAAQHALGPQQAREVAHQVPGRALRRGGLPPALAAELRPRPRRPRRPRALRRRVVRAARRRDAAGPRRPPRAVRRSGRPGASRCRSRCRWGTRAPRTCAALAALMREHGLDEVRTAQDQNLVLRDVPVAKVAAVVGGLEAIGLGLPRAGDNVVACPGTSTCRLGITASQEIAAKLANAAGDLRLRVSGCHNGCAQPETGDIGIYGEGRRLHDRLVPHYQFYLGGDGTGGGRLARKGPSVPVARAQAAIVRLGEAFRREANPGERFFAWVHRQADDYFDSLLADLVAVEAEQLPDVLRDVDGTADFKVAQLGGGECAGVSQVFIGAAFYASAHERRYREAFAAQSRDAEAVACARAQLRLIAQGVNDLVNPAASFRVRRVIEDLRELAAAIEGKVPQGVPGGLASFAAALAAEAGPAERAATFRAIDAWVAEVGKLCVERDPQLDIASALPSLVTVPVRLVRDGVAVAAD